MYLIRIERTFCAAHSLEVNGVREPVHGHNWHVVATVAGSSLDSDGLLVDFHAVERALGAVVGRFDNHNLNQSPPFDRINPTAELVAQYVAVSLAPSLPAGVRVQSVSISEAPGCTATYINPFEHERAPDRE